MNRVPSWVWLLLPLGLLAGLSVLVARGGRLDFLRAGAPPVEELVFERVTLSPGVIRVEVANGGPDPVTVAQVMVDDAFWRFTITPDATIGRLGRATIELPYPWVENEAHGSPCSRPLASRSSTRSRWRGCPFIQTAKGNVATEDTANMLHEMGIQTGVDIKKVAELSCRMGEFLGKELPAKMHKLI